MYTSQYSYATTDRNRLREITDMTKRERVILALLDRRGRIVGSDGGDFLEWPVHMRNPKPRGAGTDTPPAYSPPDNKRVAQLPWSWYHHGIELDRKTIQTNKGKQAFINVMNDANLEIETAFSQRWPEYFYQNGDSPPNGEPNPMHGFYTWFSKFIASTSAANQGYQGKVRLCTGSYATLTMDLGTESSEWEGSDGSDTVQADDAVLGVTAGQKWWPEGQGDAAYDYWHPLVVKARSTSWGASPGFNSVYCEKQLDFAIMYSCRNSKGDKGPVDTVLCGTTPMLTIRERFGSTYRTLPELMQDPGGGVKGGMGRAYATPIYIYNGCYLVQDYDMPNAQDLLGLNLNTITYQPVHNYDPASGSTPLMDRVDDNIPGGRGRLIGAYSLGQLKIDSPRNSFIIDGDLV